jgi:hypothetical protein
MGRIVAQVTVTNAIEPDRHIRFDALVDTGSSLLVLPRAWKDRLGKLPASSTVEMETADQRGLRPASFQRDRSPLGRYAVPSRAFDSRATGPQSEAASEVCGPVRIEVEGFRPIYSEVAFLDMHPTDGTYEPLLGYVVLEQAGIAVDMLGHRLVKAKHMDLK